MLPVTICSPTARIRGFAASRRRLVDQLADVGVRVVVQGDDLLGKALGVTAADEVPQRRSRARGVYVRSAAARLEVGAVDGPEVDAVAGPTRRVRHGRVHV